MAVNVLYITYDGLTDPLGQSQILPYLQGLSQHGYCFTIISFEKKERYETEKASVLSTIAGAGIRWVPLPFTKRPPVVAKLWDRWAMWRTARRLHLLHRFHVVHCRSYVPMEAGLKLKRRYGVKLIFDMRGFWADERIDNGQWNQKHLFFRQLYKQYKRKETLFLLQADGIVALTEAAKLHLRQQQQYRSLMINVIPCCADLDHFNYHNVSPEDAAALRQSLQLGSHEKLITYLGSVGGTYMLEQMLRLFKVIQQVQPEYHMLILTKDDPQVVWQEAQKTQIDAGRLRVAYAPRQLVPLYLAASDVSVFFYRHCFSRLACSPTKHAELMGMGLPVVCNNVGDTGHLIQQTGTGFVVNDFSHSSFAAAAASLPHLLGISKEHIRQTAYRYFNLQEGIRRYTLLYESVLQQ